MYTRLEGKDDGGRGRCTEGVKRAKEDWRDKVWEEKREREKATKRKVGIDGSKKERERKKNSDR